MATLWRNRAFRILWLCFSVWGFLGNGIQQWQPSFFVRNYGLGTGELGTWLAVIYAFGGPIGIWLGGELASRYAPNNERLQLISVAVVYSLLAVLYAALYLAPSHHVAFAVLAVSAVIDNATAGPLIVATQTLVPPNMRAMAIALIYFFCNLIGIGLGPLAVGALSDAWRWHLWKASRPVAQDVTDRNPDPWSSLKHWHPYSRNGR